MKTHDLQELSKTYLHISRTRRRLQHVLLTHYLTLYFPEIERFWTTRRNEWFIRLLLQHIVVVRAGQMALIGPDGPEVPSLQRDPDSSIATQ